MVDEREDSSRWEITARTLRPLGPRSDYYSLNATFPRSSEVNYTFARHGTAADNRRIRRGLFALGFDEEAVNGLCPYERF
ncbi:MAG: hypothetical protein KC731_27150 [Myxococcales bacterium]|nr:hypothetical protein [Myxococcales bacterium]